MRHGHVDYFSPELSDPRLAVLTQEGRAQAQAAGVALANIPFDIAVHSDLARTRATCEIVLSGGDHALEPVGDLRFEELKSGWLEAKSREELAARLAYAFEGAESAEASFLPDGEKFADAEARVVAGLEALFTGPAWKNGLLVAHEGINRIILGWASGGGLATISSFEQDLCCVNVLDVDVTPSEDGAGLTIERVLIKAMNITPYDYVKHGLSKTSLEHLFDIDFEGAPPRQPLA